jgi:phosphoglycolate phosphatase-like HAD superfamily hydrolase
LYTFLFDIDGTLIDSAGAGGRAMGAAFAEVFGVDKPFAAVDLIGRTDAGILREVCLEHLGREATIAETERFYTSYLGLLEVELQEGEGYRVLPGCAEVLETLEARGDVLIGLGTGNIEAGAKLKLAGTSFLPYVRFGGYGGDAPERSALLRRGVERARAVDARVSTDPRDIWVIGDSLRDVEAAKAIGATSVALASGWQDEACLATATPDHLFPDMHAFHRSLQMGLGSMGSVT